MSEVVVQKSFSEVFEEIKAGITKSKKKGKPIIAFSKPDFDKLAKAFLNDFNYTTGVVSAKADTIVTKEVMPVQMFRAKTILMDFGVDSQEVQKVLDTYQFRNIDGMYEVCSELIYNYIKAGRKFDFMPKDDFNGGVLLKHMDGFVGEYTDITTKQKIKVRKEGHNLLKMRSKCPAWKKHRVSE